MNEKWTLSGVFFVPYSMHKLDTELRRYNKYSSATELYSLIQENDEYATPIVKIFYTLKYNSFFLGSIVL